MYPIRSHHLSRPSRPLFATTTPLAALVAALALLTVGIIGAASGLAAAPRPELACLLPECLLPASEGTSQHHLNNKKRWKSHHFHPAAVTEPCFGVSKASFSFSCGHFP